MNTDQLIESFFEKSHGSVESTNELQHPSQMGQSIDLSFEKEAVDVDNLLLEDTDLS